MRDALKFIEQMPSAYAFTVAEQALVTSLHSSTLTHQEMWDGSVKGASIKRKDRNDLKKNIKNFLEDKQSGYCYYCGFSFVYRNGKRGYKGIHRDHIAPKSKYRYLTFESKNLILACAKCNSSDYKGDSETVDLAGTQYSNFVFKIVHPYFDKLSDHLKLQDDGQLVLVNKSKKGKATKDMFGLDETYEVELRAVSQLFDKHKVKTTADLIIAITTNSNLTIHK